MGWIVTPRAKNQPIENTGVGEMAPRLRTERKKDVKMKVYP
jgi:hypothetical protein